MTVDGWIPGLKGRIETLTIESDVLRGNPLGDPATRHVLVYLPPGDSDARVPVVLCLAGFTGTGRQLLHDRPWRAAVPRQLEELMARGTAGPMILVFPDAFTRLGGSQYKNSSAVGRYEEHVVEELVPAVAERYAALDRPRHWGIMGMSSGGYGSMRLGMRHPETFSAIACHSGDMYFPYCYLPNIPRALRMLERHGGVLGFLKAFDDLPRKTNEYVAALDMIAMSACYSPHETGSGFDLPVDPATGRLRDDVWERWLNEDPVNMVELPQYQAALRSMRLVYLDCGTRDEYNLDFGARILADRLRELEIPHHHEEYDDGHSGMAYRPLRSLPLLWNALREKTGA
jgi:enterochelin esterase family protein